MDSRVNEKDFALLARDGCTFAVLDRILRGPCDLVRSNHEDLILCHSEAFYPVWIWTPDGLPEARKEAAWSLASALRPLSGGFRYNLKCELAEFIIAKAGQAGLNAGIAMRIFAYDCPDPVLPAAPADGGIRACAPEDAEEAADLRLRMIAEAGEEPPSRADCTEKIRALIGEHALFFWKDAAGKAVACCSYRVSRGLASLSGVYTRPEARRKHYAQHLVFRVTQAVRDMGYMPVLFTDADDPASNACYEKIGYRLRGQLATVSLMGQA